MTLRQLEKTEAEGPIFGTGSDWKGSAGNWGIVVRWKEIWSWIRCTSFIAILK
jgi:hypothetical protein